MPGWDEVTTFEDLQAMSPAEREAHFDASIVWDPAELTPRQQRVVDAQAARVLAREAKINGKAS